MTIEVGDDCILMEAPWTEVDYFALSELIMQGLHFAR